MTTAVKDPGPQVQAAIDAKREKTLAQLIQERQKQLESDEERVNWANRTREVIRYCRPDLLEWVDESIPPKGKSTTSYMYTSKPVIQLERASDAFCGNMFSPKGWFGLTMTDSGVGQIDQVQSWLEDCQQHLYSVYGNSNFYSAMPCIAMDAMSIGDGLLYIGNELDAGLPFFEYRNPLSLWWQRDHQGRIIMIHEKWTMKAHEAYNRWGSNLGKDAQLAAESNPAKPLTFLHVVYKANDPILRDINFRRKRPYIELWIQENAQENTGHENPAYEGGLDRMGGIVAQEGYFEMPFMDWPYWLKSGETHGRGPLASALFTLKRCHAEHKQMMLAGQRAAAPSLWATRTLQAKIDLSPDGVTWIQDPNTDKVGELHRNINYPFGMDQLDRTEQEIAQALSLDYFMMFSGITKQMRVDEIIERIGEKAAILSPRIGLMQRLLLNQCHARVFQIERLHGRMPQPPDILFELAQQYGVDTSVMVQYQGPLASAHEQVFLHRRLASASQMLQPFFNMDPSIVRAKVDTAKGVEWVMDETGLANLVRPDDEFEEIMAAQSQAAAEVQEAETARNQADAMKKMAAAQKTISETQE